MKKILVLFATVVVMMMVTGCENPADVHIPTQEELWVAEVKDINENGELFESSSARYILAIHGGLNGNGNWSMYLKDVEYVVSTLSKRFRSVELYDWKNDVVDDVWDLKLVLRS